MLEGIQRSFLTPEVLQEAQRRGRVLFKARSAQKPAESDTARIYALKAEVANLTDAIAQGAFRSSPAIATKLRAAEQELERLEAVPEHPLADVER